VVSIFRRRPSQWFHLLRWRLGEGLLEPGVWVRKKLCPKWCDLSTDGELLLCHLSGNFKGSYRGYTVRFLASAGFTLWPHRASKFLGDLARALSPMASPTREAKVTR